MSENCSSHDAAQICYIKGIGYILRILCHFSTRDTTLVTLCLLFCTGSPSETGNYSKSLPFFPFRVDLFSEERQNNFERVASFENVSTLIRSLEIHDMYLLNFQRQDFF